MTYATIDDLRSQLGAKPSASVTEAYAKKMLHKIPDATVVDRPKFILEQCKGKRVLEFGASGPMTTAIRGVTSAYLGVDRQSSDGIVGFDLDDVTWQSLPGSEQFNNAEVFAPDVIVCGELLEHLANPGYFLQRLKAQYAGVPVIITVPNAFTKAGQRWAAKGYDCVNIDHVCWFSPRTLWTLLERYGFKVEDWFWYNGEPFTAEGLIVVAR